MTGRPKARDSFRAVALVLATVLALALIEISPTAEATATGLATSDFSVLGFEGVQLKQGASVDSGHVGSNEVATAPFLANGAEVSIGLAASVDPSSTVYADTVFLKTTANVTDVVANELDGQGSPSGTWFTPVSLPLVSDLPATPVFAPGSDDVSVAPGDSVTLSPGAHGVLDADQGSTVTFTGGEYHFSSWDVGQHVSLHFLAPSDVYVDGRLHVDNDSSIGSAPGGPSLDASDIVLWSSGINGSAGNVGSTPKAVKFGLRSSVSALVYAPYGTIHLRQGATLTGQMVGRWVIVGLSATVTLETAASPASSQVTVHLGSLTSATIDLYTADGVTGQVSGTAAVTVADQSGTVVIAAAPGIYDIRIAAGQSAVIIDALDCTAGSCSTPVSPPPTPDLDNAIAAIDSARTQWDLDVTLGGVWIDADAGVMYISIVGDITEASGLIDLAGLDTASNAIELVPAQFTLAELEATFDVIASDYMALAGFNVHEVSLAQEQNRVLVQTSDADATALTTHLSGYVDPSMLAIEAGIPNPGLSEVGEYIDPDTSVPLYNSDPGDFTILTPPGDGCTYDDGANAVFQAVGIAPTRTTHDSYGCDAIHGGTRVFVHEASVSNNADGTLGFAMVDDGTGEYWMTLSGHVATLRGSFFDEASRTGASAVFAYGPKRLLGRTERVYEKHPDVAVVQPAYPVDNRLLIDDPIDGMNGQVDLIPVVGTKVPEEGMPIHINGVRGGLRTGIIASAKSTDPLYRFFTGQFLQPDVMRIDMDGSAATSHNAILGGDSGSPVFWKSGNQALAVGLVFESSQDEVLADDIRKVEDTLGMTVATSPQPAAGAHGAPVIAGVVSPVIDVVDAADPVVLTGTVSDDGGPHGLLTANWELLSTSNGVLPGNLSIDQAPHTATLSPVLADLDVTAELTVPQTPGSYTLRLTAADGDKTASLLLAVTVSGGVLPGGVYPTNDYPFVAPTGSYVQRVSGNTPIWERKWDSQFPLQAPTATPYPALPGAAGGLSLSSRSRLANAGDDLFLYASRPIIALSALYHYDAAAAQWQLVHNLPVVQNNDVSLVTDDSDDGLFIASESLSGGYEIWQYDRSFGGAGMVLRFSSQPGASIGSDDLMMYEDGAGDRHLWWTEESTGATLVRQYNIETAALSTSPTSGSLIPEPTSMVWFNGQLYAAHRGSGAEVDQLIRSSDGVSWSGVAAPDAMTYMPNTRPGTTWFVNHVWSEGGSLFVTCYEYGGGFAIDFDGDLEEYDGPGCLAEYDGSQFTWVQPLRFQPAIIASTYDGSGGTFLMQGIPASYDAEGSTYYSEFSGSPLPNNPPPQDGVFEFDADTRTITWIHGSEQATLGRVALITRN